MGRLMLIAVIPKLSSDREPPIHSCRSVSIHERLLMCVQLHFVF